MEFWSFGVLEFWNLCCRFGVVWGADQGCEESVKVKDGPNECNERMLYERVTMWAVVSSTATAWWEGGGRKKRERGRKGKNNINI